MGSDLAAKVSYAMLLSLLLSCSGYSKRYVLMLDLLSKVLRDRVFVP